ncbi:MAG: hypothetical protein JJU20_04245 [Opitutales bacterium]|nr:hypothetical protein [Opitutales bacterium]
MRGTSDFEFPRIYAWNFVREVGKVAGCNGQLEVGRSGSQKAVDDRVALLCVEATPMIGHFLGDGEDEVLVIRHQLFEPVFECRDLGGGLAAQDFYASEDTPRSRARRLSLRTKASSTFLTSN